MGLIQFPQCTPQPLTIDGTCQHTDYQRRFTGRLSSAAPFVILSLRKCGAAYHYLKHPSMGALDVAITLSQMPLPQADHCQHTFALADAVHLGTQSTGRVVLSGTLPLTFSAGQLFPFAVDTAAAAVSLPAGVCPEGYHSEASWQVGGTPTPVGTAGGIVGAGALDNAARGDPPHIGRGRTGGLLRRSEGAQQWG